MSNVNDITYIWNKYHQNIERYVGPRISDKEDVGDIVQDIFVKIQTGISKLESTLKIQSWMYTIARNTITDFYRQHNVRKVSTSHIYEVKDDEKILAEEEIARGLLPMVANLPKIYREAIFLSQFKGLPNKEIAIKLGVSVSGVKSRVQRGRFLLKKMLLDCCEFELDSNRRIADYEPQK